MSVSKVSIYQSTCAFIVQTHASDSLSLINYIWFWLWLWLHTHNVKPSSWNHLSTMCTMHGTAHTHAHNLLVLVRFITNGIVFGRACNTHNHLFFTDPKLIESFVTNHQHVIGVDIEPWTSYRNFWLCWASSRRKITIINYLKCI